MAIGTTSNMEWLSGGGSGTSYNAGTGIDITNDTISVKIDGSTITTNASGELVANGGGVSQVQSDWAQTNNQAVDYIKNKPQNLVQDASYVHTDNNFTNSDKDKLDGIESGAEVNVQSDWNVTDNTSDAFIRNKPTIPSGNQLLPPATSADEDKVLTIDSHGDPQWETPSASTQQQADWAQTNSSAVDYIKNKPTIVTPVQSDWNQTNSSALDYIKNKPAVLGQAKDLVAGTNITLQQNSNSVIISAQYAGATYNTQQISGSGHIYISSTANISTDLTESGELAAFYRVRYTASANGWEPSSTVGDGGALFTMSVGSTNAYTEFHDYTGGVFTQNHFESLARTGSIDTYSGYLYSVHFNSNGQIYPRPGYSMYFEFIENLPGSTSEYSWVSDGYSQTAAPIDLSYDTIGGKTLKLKMYNINSNQLSVYSYPYISIIVRRL